MAGGQSACSVSPADSPLDDSDSEGEGLAELSVDDWLRFQMDKEVGGRVRATLCVLLPLNCASRCADVVL